MEPKECEIFLTRKTIERILEWYEKKNITPTHMELKITNQCNLRCLSCPTDEILRKRPELSEKELIDVIDQGHKLGVIDWFISGGGEPFVRKETTLRIMELIKRHGGYGSIITNGTLFKKDDVEQIINMEWDGIIFSIDGPDAKTNDFLRGKGTFEKVINIIKEFSKFKNRLNRKLPETVIASVLTNKNYNKIEGIVKLAHRWGVDEVMLQALAIWSPGIKKLALNREKWLDFQKHLREAVRVAERLNVRVNFLDFINSEISITEDVRKIFKSNTEIEQIYKKTPDPFLECPCFAPFFEIGVQADGTVGPCKRSTVVCGNIKEKTLSEIWYGKQFNEMRKNMIKHKMPDFCSKCYSGELAKNFEIRKNLRSKLNPPDKFGLFFDTNFVPFAKNKINRINNKIFENFWALVRNDMNIKSLELPISKDIHNILEYEILKVYYNSFRIKRLSLAYLLTDDVIYLDHCARLINLCLGDQEHNQDMWHPCLDKPIAYWLSAHSFSFDILYPTGVLGDISDENSIASKIKSNVFEGCKYLEWWLTKVLDAPKCQYFFAACGMTIAAMKFSDNRYSQHWFNISKRIIDQHTKSLLESYEENPLGLSGLFSNYIEACKFHKIQDYYKDPRIISWLNDTFQIFSIEPRSWKLYILLNSTLTIDMYNSFKNIF